jgi:hypothetical protein
MEFKETRNSCVMSTSHMTEFDYQCLTGMIGNDDELLVFTRPDGYGLFIYLEEDFDIHEDYEGELSTQFMDIYTAARDQGFDFIRVSPDAPKDCITDAEVFEW